MTFRELSTEVMLSKGMALEEIKARQKLSSGIIPGALTFVDSEIPPEDVEQMRQYLSLLHDAAVLHPECARAFIDEHMGPLQAKN